jgi:hypothetical protein
VADLALDPTVVEEHVRRLNRQADSLGLLGVVLGAPVGAVIGGLPLVAHGPIPSKFGIATLLLGALLTGTLGYIVAKGRSFGYRLKAQLMLGQLRLEQNVEALLAVSERPDVPALAAAEPMHALPEPPRIEELVDAGLAMPTHAPVVDYAPPVEPEEIAPLPEPEPLPVPEPVQLPSWAADLERAMAAAVPTPAPPTPSPEPEQITPLPEPEPLPVPEPVQLPSWAADLERAVPAAAPTPAPPAPSSEPEPAPPWSLPVREEPVPTPTLPAWAEPQEVVPAPTPAPEPSPEPAPTHVWAVPAAEEQQPEPEVAPPAPAPAPPAAAPDLSTLSISEIARLADAGSL